MDKWYALYACNSEDEPCNSEDEPCVRPIGFFPGQREAVNYFASIFHEHSGYKLVEVEISAVAVTRTPVEL